MARKSKARTVATIDCETDPFLFGRVPRPFLWDVFDGVKHYTYDKTSDVIDFLSDKHWRVYAHNGGKFDYHMPSFLDELTPFEPIMLINGRLAKFVIGECEFRDSYNILPVPLAAYKKEDIDYCKMEKSVRHLHMDEITKYLHKDTEYLFELVTKFRDMYGDGLTLAGSAMKFWEQHSRSKAPRTSRGFYRTFKQFYYGGRVECFRKGVINEPFSMADINSAYPYAMLHEHPISDAARCVCPQAGEPIIPQSMYTLEAQAHGQFPFIEKGKLCFPSDGKVRAFNVTGWELLSAIDTGTLASFHVSARYDFEKTINFKKYIQHFYDIKASEKKDSAPYIFAKLFMNSLYGKFGACPDNYNNFTIAEPQYKEAAGKDGYNFAGELGQWIVLKTPLDESQAKFYNVATAASITGFVRAFLWRHICAVRAAGGAPIYCDTDSIAYVGADSPFAIGKDLGQWTLEGRFDRGGVAGKKMYAFHHSTPQPPPKKQWKYGCKGVRLTPEQVMEVCQGKTVTYKRDAPSLGLSRTVPDACSAEDASRFFITRNVKMT